MNSLSISQVALGDDPMSSESPISALPCIFCEIFPLTLRCVAGKCQRMSNKVAKGLWLAAELVEAFDREVERLSQLVPDKLESGEVGAAALLTFLSLPDDKQKLEAIRAARNHVLDRVIDSLP